MPAVLTENFFMDNFEEYKDILMTSAGRQKIINFHVKAIVKTMIQVFNEPAPNNFML